MTPTPTPTLALLPPSGGRRAAALLLLAAAVAGCSGTAPTRDFARVVRAGAAVEVTVTGQVSEVLPDGHGPAGPHERFVLVVDGVPVEIDHNLGLAGRAPVRPGDTVTVHGQYEPDPGHPVIHYTHHATGRHEGGYVQLRGRTYALRAPAGRLLPPRPAAGPAR